MKNGVLRGPTSHSEIVVTGEVEDGEVMVDGGEKGRNEGGWTKAQRGEGIHGGKNETSSVRFGREKGRFSSWRDLMDRIKIWIIDVVKAREEREGEESTKETRVANNKDDGFALLSTW